jgi:hypothetical protein
MSTARHSHLFCLIVDILVEACKVSYTHGHAFPLCSRIPRAGRPAREMASEVIYGDPKHPAVDPK